MSEYESEGAREIAMKRCCRADWILPLPMVVFSVIAAALGASLSASDAAGASDAKKPNIVIVFADDLGYGDAACFDPQHAKVLTPNIDRLAAEGMRLTDAHTSGSLCSPSRYGLLTGRYSWRTAMRSHVVRVYGSPLIATDRLTLPKMLAQNGYHTACIGKWHLGWNWPLRQEDGTIEHAPAGKFTQQRSGEPVFELSIKDGPDDAGIRRVLRRGRAKLPAVHVHSQRPHGRRSDGPESGQRPRSLGTQRTDGARLEVR